MKKNKKDKLRFKALKVLVRIRYRKPKFVFLGDKPENGSLIISNHEGAAVPLQLETYADFPTRMWGTYEINSGIKNLYRYQSQVYYHKKRHLNLFLSKLICLIVSPLTNSFYKGLNLISTYPDARLLKTLNESVSAIKNDGDNIVVFPEDSADGYKQKLEGFAAGFVLLAQTLLKQGIDVPVFAAYYVKKTHEYIFDKPERFSEIKNRFTSRYEIASYLMDKCNALGEKFGNAR